MTTYHDSFYHHRAIPETLLCFRFRYVVSVFISKLRKFKPLIMIFDDGVEVSCSITVTNGPSASPWIILTSTNAFTHT